MMGWTCPGYGMGGGWGGAGFLGMLPGIFIFFGLLLAVIFGILWFTRRARLQRVTGLRNESGYE